MAWSTWGMVYEHTRFINWHFHECNLYTNLFVCSVPCICVAAWQRHPWCISHCYTATFLDTRHVLLFVCFFFRKIGKLSQLCFLVNQSTASLTSHNTCKQVMMTRSFPHRNIRLAGHSELSMVPLLCDGLLTFCLQCLNLLQGFGPVTCLLPLLPGQTLAPPTLIKKMAGQMRTGTSW